MTWASSHVHLTLLAGQEAGCGMVLVAPAALASRWPRLLSSSDMKRAELQAEDLWPLVEKLSDEERIRLAYWALRVRPRGGESGNEAPLSEEEETGLREALDSLDAGDAIPLGEVMAELRKTPRP